MVQNRQVTLLGDSILKGIQVDLGDRRYRTHNEINVEALESEFQLSIHNDAHFGATVRKGSRLLDRMLARKLPCDMMVMDFGGNDCDFRWKEIAEDPTGPSAQRAAARVCGAVPGDDPAGTEPRYPAHPYQPAAAGQRALFQLVVRRSG